LIVHLFLITENVSVQIDLGGSKLDRNLFILLILNMHQVQPFTYREII